MKILEEFIHNNILLKHTKYEGYYAGIDGNLYSVWKTGAGARSEQPFDYNKVRLIKAGTTTKCPYMCSKIRSEGKYVHILIHRVVLETFCPNENSENLVVNHIDTNKLNNKLENLEWLDRSENLIHAVYNNLIHNQKEVRCTNISTGEIKIFPSINEGLRFVGSKSGINNLEKKKSVIRKGWRFELNN